MARRSKGGGVTVSVNVKYNHLGRMKRNLPIQTSAAMRKAALLGERKAKSLCPVDTGTLKGSITTVGVYPGSLKMQILTTAGYGAYVNFGTRYMSAQPFMTQAGEYAAQIFKAELAGLVNRL